MTESDFQPLFTDLQRYVCDILNQDTLLSSWGVNAYPESSLDIEYEMQTALAKQGLTILVSSLKGEYQGHDGLTEAYNFDGLELQIIENPPIRRPWLKKNQLSCGTANDVCYRVFQQLGGPQNGHFGEFCPGTFDTEVDNDLLVVRARLKTCMRNDVSGLVSVDVDRRIPLPFAFQWQIDALSSAISGQTSEYLYNVDKTIRHDVSGWIQVKSGDQWTTINKFQLSTDTIDAYTKAESDERFMEKTPSEIQLYSSSTPYPIFIGQNNDGNLVFNDNPYSVGSTLKPDDTPVMTSAQMSAYCKTTEADTRYLLIDNLSKPSKISAFNFSVYDPGGTCYMTPNGGQIGCSYSGRSFIIDTTGCSWANTSRNYTNKFSFGSLSGTHTYKFQPLSAGTITCNVAMQEWVARDYLPKSNGTAVNLTLSSTDMSNIQIQAGHGGFDFSTDGETWHSASLPNEDGTLATQNYVDTQIGNIDTILQAIRNG